MAQQNSLKVLAARVLINGFAESVNGCFKNATAGLGRMLNAAVKPGVSRELDFSETSVPLIAVVLANLSAEPDGALAKELTQAYNRFPPSQRLEYVVRDCYFYLAEVACRCLDAEWTEKKKFLSEAVIGIRLANGIFYSQDEFMTSPGRKEMNPEEAYLMIKATTKGLKPNQVHLEPAHTPVAAGR
jgi:hypothetical protein